MGNQQPNVMKIEQQPQQVAMTPRLVDELHMPSAEFANCFPIFLMPLGLARIMCCELTPTNKVLVRGSYLVSTADLINLKNNIENILNNAQSQPAQQETPQHPNPTTAADKFIEDMKRQAERK